MGKPEEFPDFIAYYLEQPSADSETIVVYGLLDSPSVAGAYRFAITNGDVLLMDIDSALWARTTAAWAGTGARKSTIPTACRCGPVPVNGSGGRC
ncbi:hypothetical protein G6F60_014417 [Rhizopus arrhizus]|nr:hypothetical protein G6F24_015762 [Rhizopus arrhizus]KAG1386623.1 hypothetical protein G6F60_014417 [Rhizopus arrhizus]